MAAFSVYLQQKLLDHAFKTAAYSQPTNIYIGLTTSSPSDSTIGTEVAGENYARVAANSWTAATSASPSVISNDSVITFPTPGVGGWGLVTHFIVMDSLEDSTNLLAWGQLTTPKSINENDVVAFSEGQISISLD